MEKKANHIEYKGYIAKIKHDVDAALFHGAVINTSDVITFQGKTKDELPAALKDSVEEYLRFCLARNENPELPDEFIKSCLEAKDEAKEGKLTPYVRGKRND